MNNSTNERYSPPSFLKNIFLNLNYLPRWIVLFIDVCILIIANAITFLLLTHLQISFYPTLSHIERYTLIVLVNTCFFLYYRTFAGIIRYSSSIDAIKLLFSTTSSLVVLIAINYGSYFLLNKKIFLLGGWGDRAEKTA